jgi:adenylate cyclase
MSDLFDTITQWLLAQALSEKDMVATLSGMGARLVEGGVPVSRIGMGRPVMHPTIGMMDMQWSSDTGRVQSQEVARSAMTKEMLSNNPFGDLISGECDRIHADLRDPDEIARYSIFQQFADSGVTGYLAFSRGFGQQQSAFLRIVDGSFGAALSFSTKRFSGFSLEQLDGLERLVPAFCVCSRVDSDRRLASDVLEAYLGRISGKKVLAGQVVLGDGEQIDCAIFYSDLRASIALSQSLDIQTYLDTVNAYFACTATAVAEHGGEVLKFIGDGVLAIFPFDDETRPRQNMCDAALASAQEAFARAANANTSRDAQGLPALEFGIALHVGKVIYGNVGTQKRLDFTATGPAVGLAARIEGLTRHLDKPLLATQAFADLCATKGLALPAQSVRGFDAPVEIVGYDENG